MQWGDLEFEVTHGTGIPKDYHYILYSAVKSKYSSLTDDGWKVYSKNGNVVIRCAEKYVEDAVGTLAEDFLRLGDDILRLGMASWDRIKPIPVMTSTPVIVTSDSEDRGVRPPDYHYHIGKRLGCLIESKNFGCDIHEREPVHIAGTRHFGHRVTIKGMSDKESILLQKRCIGESNAMGLGVFIE